MNVSLIGSGYVGITTAVSFIEAGFKSICVDVDETRVELLNKGVCPFYEPKVYELVKRNSLTKKLVATTNLRKAVLDSDVSFICVGTPSREDGSIDLKYILKVSRELGKVLKEKREYHTIVVKSTVVPGTTEEKVIPLLEKYSGKRAGEDFGVVMNPEFLKEGDALNDAMYPDKIVIGQFNEKSGDKIREIYSHFDQVKKYPEVVVSTSLTTAEMIKYVNNSLLATKISFSNEIGNLCKKLGIDSYDVMKIVGMDKRFSPSFLNSGIGFGGSCFPKDVRALVSKYRELSEDSKLLDSVLEVNTKQPLKAVELLEKYDAEKVAVLGLSFKPDTDDVRSTRAAPIIEKLIEEGKEVIAWDPLAIEIFKEYYPDISSQIEFADSLEEAVNEVDAIIITTDHSDFLECDFPNIPIIEGRRVFKNKKSNVEGVCW